MTPAVPKRLVVGLPTTVALATLLLALAGSSSSESLPIPEPRLPLGLETLLPELGTPRFHASIEEARVSRPRPVPPPDLATLRRAIANLHLDAMPSGREMRDAAAEHRVDGLLVASVVEAESSFRPDAVSPKGAMGLMQLMPSHLEGVSQPLDPATNLGVGARYLSRLSRRYEGDLELVLAAYHAGPGAVRRFGGVPPYRSTRAYVGRVLTLYRSHRRQVERELAEFGRPVDPARTQRGS